MTDFTLMKKMVLYTLKDIINLASSCDKDITDDLIKGTKLSRDKFLNDKIKDADINWACALMYKCFFDNIKEIINNRKDFIDTYTAMSVLCSLYMPSNELGESEWDAIINVAEMACKRFKNDVAVRIANETLDILSYSAKVIRKSA